MHVFVTGATGFIGTELVKELIEAGHQVRGLTGRPEHAAHAVAAKGVYAAVVRLPQVHDTRRQGLATRVIQIAREKDVSAYVSGGSNRWAAAPLQDVAHLCRLAVEKTGPGVTPYHAVQEAQGPPDAAPNIGGTGPSSRDPAAITCASSLEEGVSLRDIAETIGKGLKVPVVSIPAEKAGGHFGPFFGYAAMQDMPASGEWTRRILGWESTAPGLIEDLANMRYYDFRRTILMGRM